MLCAALWLGTVASTTSSSFSGELPGMSVQGDIVDADTPVTYRLPRVSSFASPTADASPPRMAVLPPAPPIEEASNPPACISHLDSPHVGAAPPAANDEASPLPHVAAPSFHAPGFLAATFPPSGYASSHGASTADATDAAPDAGPVINHGIGAATHTAPRSNVAPTATANSDVRPAHIQPPLRVPSPIDHELTQQLLPAAQRGFRLAQRGALYAAQEEFVQVLRRAAQAKDAFEGGEARSRALAAGLRAIDEAEDFVPDGIQLEAELDVAIVASSHRTPVLDDIQREVTPHQAVVLYHNFAHEQLAYAVAGEQAGSMALYGLGKINARLAARNDEDIELTRNATTMYAAAYAARADNHLAANELGVMLCRSGSAAEAKYLFERTIDLAPTALAYHNLAVAQGKLGMHTHAAANEQQSQRLAARERSTGAVSRRAGVEWVSPEDMARVAQPAPSGSTAYHAASPASAMPRNAVVGGAPQKSRWQRIAQSLPLLGRDHDDDEPIPGPEAHSGFVSPRIPPQSGWQ